MSTTSNPDNTLITAQTVQQHACADDCWLVIDGKVWDMTAFAPRHPGGSQIILTHAGRDATTAYNTIHAPSLIEEEVPEAYKGRLDPSTVPKSWTTTTTTTTTTASTRPALTSILNTHDFAHAAQHSIPAKTWAFYSSAATDSHTHAANTAMYARIWFRPRVLRDVSSVSIKARFLGCAAVDMPIYVAPAAMARMVHVEGERAIARACARKGVLQCISTSASFPASQIVPVAPPAHPFFFQLYINSNRAKCAALIREIAAMPQIRGIMITVDAPVVGKREADERIRADETLHAPMSGQQAKNDAKGGGMGRVMGRYIDPSFHWEEIAWVRGLYSGPLMLKGVQTAADARMAVEYGVQGIVVSNHGGRCLDTSPPSILALLDIQRNAPEVFDKMEVYVDGGIRRGTDIVKALCLGATGVGLGRPFLYSLAYGTEGVEHLIDILRDEIETTMRLLGANSLSDLHPGMVNTADVDHLVPRGLDGHPYARNVERAKL
ncbi:putative mitochondrial cytochrome b2 [Pseudovirgaria hyperparasitica]|uniref:L-lactate dehydrogenase (cytochrome) n=1 Tax=Pseudovirgaria hyperparasitica TaxID=470096 RepID=A0A6A6WA50_9PEZI|nr:putative mitochondrial cytochrome b2 [Pseudovirgaria hyperparasitica]KAF2759445.1 putative mitochondrial cytochrome b2 [Pseudovirgaria hyperparasitica]